MKKDHKQPRHKPNKRHVLNEVLQSLQDLLHNELADVHDNESRIESTADKEAILNSLHALIGDQPEAISKGAGSRRKPRILEPNVDDSGPNPAETIQSQTGKTRRTPLITNDEYERNMNAPSDMPNLDPEISQTDGDFHLEMGDADQTVPTHNTLAHQSSGDAQNDGDRRRHQNGATDPEQVEINWDDIPVLNEIAAPPPAPDTELTQEARNIAIKVAAALNVEMRKQGSGQMDVKAILKLQSLIRNELEDRNIDHSLGTNPPPKTP